MDDTTVLSASTLGFELVWTLLIIVKLHTTSLVCDEATTKHIKIYGAVYMYTRAEILKILVNGRISRLERERGASDVHVLCQRSKCISSQKL